MAGKPSKSVLIVDDVAFVRKTLAEILGGAGYKIVGEASDGKEAVKMFTDLRPDLVTMDVVMPVMSGLEAARSITRLDPNAKIVVISAMGQESLIMEAINAGARDYILKPFTGDDVLKTIERVFTVEAAATSRTANLAGLVD